MLKNRRHDHIGIASNNLKMTVDWYVNVLGFKHYGACVATDGTPCQFITNLGLNIEVYEIKDEKNVGIAGKIDHFAFISEDIEKDYEYCKIAGLQCITESIVDVPDAWENGCRYFKITSISGEDIEFVQTL